MQIDGFSEYAADEAVWEARVFVSDAVVEYFETEGQEGRRNEMAVVRVQHTLRTLRRHGLARVGETEQFKREGKFPSGRRRGGDQVVYEAKKDQVRVYGGPITVGRETVYLFVTGVTKKENRADQKLLQRVAKILGAISDDLERRK
jgi:hypothetical protein